MTGRFGFRTRDQDRKKASTRLLNRPASQADNHSAVLARMVGKKVGQLKTGSRDTSGRTGKTEDLCEASDVVRNGRVGETIPRYSVVLLHRRDRAGVVEGEQSELILPGRASLPGAETRRAQSRCMSIRIVPG